MGAVLSKLTPHQVVVASPFQLGWKAVAVRSKQLPHGLLGGAVPAYLEGDPANFWFVTDDKDVLPDEVPVEDDAGAEEVEVEEAEEEEDEEAVEDDEEALLLLLLLAPDPLEAEEPDPALVEPLDEVGEFVLGVLLVVPVLGRYR